MTAEEYYEQGKAYFEAGNHQQAEEAYAQAIEQEGGSAALWIGLGDVYQAQEKVEEAIGAYEEAVALEAENIQAWLAVARAYAGAGQLQEALEAYQQSIRLDSQLAEPWNGLGVLYFEGLGKPQLGIRCFQRMEHLGKGLFAGNLFAAFAQLPPHPFFSYRIIRDYMPPEEYGKRAKYIGDTLEAALPLQAYINRMSKKQDAGAIPARRRHTWLGVLDYLMGDPSAALEQLEKSRQDGAPPELMASYYQLQACWELQEPDGRFLEPALERAAAFLPPAQSGWKFWQKKEEAAALTGEEFEQCYYAGLIFVENDEMDKALLCFERIEQDFLPAAYQAFWCCEELVQLKKKKEKAEFILEQESRQRQFVDGLPAHYLSPDDEDPLNTFLKAIRYQELAEAIEQLHLHAEFEGNPFDFEVQASSTQLPFYQLWQWLPGGRQQAMAALSGQLGNAGFRALVEAFLRDGKIEGGEEEE